ncbi:unnamed protein product [Mytilus edulis]|uniref:C-type lectin domain-containing protein n=1 Tax=Mytilus edulis TaxID=6550 RepID=A0A8S3SE75_MYTED|nr:unnamed protein product [Mytilus edulis]
MSLPCLTNESEKDFDDSRKALSALETYLGSTVNTLESDIQKTLNTLKSHLGTLKSNVGSKVKRLDGDLKVLEEDFRKNVGYWIGLTDLKEGDWRWTFDQSNVTYKQWSNGNGSKELRLIALLTIL